MKKLNLGLIAATCLLAACTSKTTTTTGSDSTATYLKNIKATALASDSAFNKKDLTAAFKDYAPGFIEYGSGSSKPVTNVDSIKISTKSFFDAFPDFNGAGLKAVAEDSTVIITGTWTGTFKNEFMKIKPTNKSFKVFDADIFTFNKAGKITSHKNIQAETTFLYQLGVPIPPKK